MARGAPALRRDYLVGFACMVACIVVAPWVLYPIFLMRVLCFAIFVMAFNLLAGYAGLVSFGHAAFFGMGAYIAAWTAKQWGLSAELAIVCGALVGGALGGAVGLLAIRRTGIYFAMVTLALAQLVYFFCVQVPFTHGENGIQQVPRAPLFGVIPLSGGMAMYWFVAGVFLICFVAIHRIIHSPFGNVLQAIRENEPRATSLGYRTRDYKWIAFILSALFSGLAGGLLALVFGLATLETVRWTTSGEVVLMALVGGFGTIFGPLVGALVLAAMENYLAPYGAWVTVVQGAIFVAAVLLFRRGIIGEVMAKAKLSL
ncbi:MAG: branched-chain amino acid ABC transporter permease [Acetobacteraceae bacterium]